MSCSPESSFITAHSTVFASSRNSHLHNNNNNNNNTISNNHNNTSNASSSSPVKKRSIGVIAAKTVSSTNLLNSADSVSISSEQEETVRGGVTAIDRAPSLREISKGGGESSREEEEIERDSSSSSTATEPPSLATGDDESSPSARECIFKAADYVVAVHRQLSRQDTYFLQYHKTKPNLFGVPLLVPWYEGCTNKDLYCAVWIQVARFLSPLPPTPPDQANHATDW